MKYTSQNGCFYYYDSVLYRWQIAEPTLLFILGLESVLSSDKSQTDKITISKYIYHTYNDKVEPLNYIHEIFDDIYSFLSKIGSVEDFEHYIKFNCYGLKLILNELTGSSTDRTIPIIFKNDANKLIVSDLIADMSPTRDSYYDCQAKVIIDTFSNAGYELTLDTSGKPNFLIYKSNSNVKEELAELLNDDDHASASRALRKKLLKDITTYNDDLIAKHKERLQTESIYNLIDYKAMYAYSLGVLYGCRCIGFEDTVIWRLDPKFWYNGEYNNLVRTAWFAFRFHWTLKDEEQDDELVPSLLSNRQLIQDNKIWNFKNTEDIVNPPLAQDEHQCFCLYVNKTTGEKVSESLLYSLEKKIDESEPRGSFLRKYISLTNSDVIWKWLPITTKVSDGDSSNPMKGVISSRDTPLIRYIGNDQVIIYRAYQYSKDEFLAPKPDGVYKKYFVYTGDLGWVDFKENSFCDNNSQTLLDNVTNSLNGSYTEVKNFLSAVPEKPNIKYLQHAYPKTPSSEVSGAVTYYKCYVTDNKNETLYGVYNKYIDKSNGNYYIDNNIPSNFYQILSYKLFDSLYGNIENGGVGSDIYNAFYYDLNKEIKLTLNQDGTIVCSRGEGESEDHTPEYFGYSTEPSSLLTLYYTKENEIAPVFPLEKEYRYISKGKNSLHWNSDEDSRQWLTVNNDNSLYGKYRLTDKVINMYRGEVKISDLTNMPVYNNYTESLGNPPNTLTKYIYCNESLLFDSVDRYNFIAVGNYENQDTLYRLGITEYLCPFVKEDDYKNSLLDDDGKPLVWHDPKYKVYWNGLYGINRWQKTKPSRNSLSMFDVIANTLLPVFIDSEAQLISIDGEEAITYDAFYSNSNYGVVRTKLKVFNPEISDEIKECYCDTKSDPSDYVNAIYCIPGITIDGWKSRSEITELGWWFVDGTTTLYSGSESNEFVTDNDHND